VSSGEKKDETFGVPVDVSTGTAPPDRPSTRPLVDDLEDVPEHEFILRFVGYTAWDDAPADARSFLTSAFVQTGEFGPAADSYGPSVWRESKLPADVAAAVAALEKCHPGLAHKGIVRVPVRDVLACNIRVKASPDDAEPAFAAHRDAHASFVGINRAKRDDLVDRCQAFIYRRPPNGSKKPGTP
jgi:hypothetical protein